MDHKELVQVESLRGQYCTAQIVDQEVLPPVFNYNDLGDPVLAEEVKSAAGRLRSKLAHHLRAAIEIGQELIAIKEKVGHGRFGAWLAGEFGWSERTANNHMSLVETFTGKSEMFADLPLTVAYRIAGRSTPPEVREKLLGKIEAGGKVTTETVALMVRAGKLDEQLKKAEAALKPGQKKALDKRVEQRRAEDDRRRQDDKRRQRERAQLAAAGAALIRQRFGASIAELVTYLEVWGELGEVLRGTVTSQLEVPSASSDQSVAETMDESDLTVGRIRDFNDLTGRSLGGLTSTFAGSAVAPAVAAGQS